MPPKLNIKAVTDWKKNEKDEKEKERQNRFNKICEVLSNVENGKILKKNHDNTYSIVTVDNNGGIKLTMAKSDIVINTVSNNTMRKGASGSDVSLVSLGGIDYIEKTMPDNVNSWGSVAREIRVMNIFKYQNPKYLLLPEYVLIRGNVGENLTIDNINKHISILSKKCTPCRQFGKNCVNMNAPFTWIISATGKKCGGERNVDDLCLIKLIDDIAAGLNEMHNMNLYHKDIKPDNIVYCQYDNRWKIIDFGESRLEKDVLDPVGTEVFQDAKLLSFTLESLQDKVDSECLDEDYAFKKVLENIDYFSLFMTLRIIINRLIIRRNNRKPKQNVKNVKKFLDDILLPLGSVFYLKNLLYNHNDIITKIKGLIQNNDDIDEYNIELIDSCYDVSPSSSISRSTSTSASQSRESSISPISRGGGKSNKLKINKTKRKKLINKTKRKKLINKTKKK